MILSLINAGFLLLVFACIGLVLRAVTRAWAGQSTRGRAFATTLGGLLGWLTLTSILAGSGLLLPSPDHPPPNAALIATGLIAAAVIAFGPPGRRFTAALSPSVLVGFQTFRFFVELILWGWAEQGIGPEILTFYGHNFDICVGLTAPLIAFLVRGGNKPALVIAWNVASMIVLGVVLVTAIMISPGPLQQIFTKPDATIVARWPYVWLPAFLVPLAYTGHFLSIRQALTRRAALQAKG